MAKLRNLLVMTSIITMCITLGSCEKRYYEYDCVWVSQDGIVTLNSSGQVTINIDEVDQSKKVDALSDSGQSTFWIGYDDPEAVDDSNIIWYATSYIKNGKMYLTVEKDYVADYEGTTFVLEQETETATETEENE